MTSIINNFIIKTSRRLRKKDGMTLVEVVIAFLIIAIISTVLVRGTMTAVNTMRINTSKTEALAIANEKIEILKSIDYSEVLITEEDDSNPWMSSYLELPEAEGEFNITYLISEVDAGIQEGNGDVYKQLKVSVFGGYMIIPIGVITQLYPPVGEEATLGNIYPPPDDLAIFSDEGEGESREIILNWNAPDTERNILRYNVYRDSVFLKSTLIEYSSDYPGDNTAYTYQVTTLYEGSIESVKSNSVTSGVPFVYPPAENLVIVVEGAGPSRTANLSWEIPETELTIVRFIIYRDDIELLDIVTEPIFNDVIGNNLDQFTYYVRILYENDNLSEPGNTVSTN